MNLARIRTPEYALFFCRAASGLDIHLGRDYAVEFDYGMDYAELIEFGDLQSKYRDLKVPGFRLVRLLDNHDLENIEKNQIMAEKVRADFVKELETNRISAKVVHVRISMDRRRIFIRYYAKSLLSLQHLIKPFENRHHSSVNLWQIGVRDETRLIGCIGHCGREACCCSWMKHDCSVNLKMAKSQGIPLNPASLNGTCNRLKCCFKYENNVYEEAGAKLPKIGKRVRCSGHNNFEGIIINRDILRGKLVLRSRKGKFLTVNASEAEIKDVNRGKSDEDTNC